MSQLTRIKNRIRAIQTTKKITRAMRLIAMSLYSKLERKKAALASYQNAFNSLATDLLQNPKDLPEHLFPESIRDSRPLIILCTSTKSLCGGINSTLVKYFERTFLLEADQRADIIVVGKRAQNFVNEKKPGHIVYSADDLSMTNLEEVAHDIMKHCLDRSKGYTSVTTYYTHLKSFFSQQAVKKRLIPMEPPETQPGHDQFNLETTTWEQPRKQTIAQVAEYYLYTQITNFLFHSLISENAARFIAMDQSTSNADKYLDTLSLSYNKSRQSLITREIAELANNL